MLLFVALITLLFGTDHPNGKWSDRFLDPKALRSKDTENRDDSSVDGEKGEVKGVKGVSVNVVPTTNEG